MSDITWGQLCEQADNDGPKNILKETQKYEGSSLPYASELIAEKNQKEFNQVLKNLPNASGVYRYEIRSGNFIVYNEVRNIFVHLTDMGGYRKYSLSTATPLTSTEEEDLYHDVGLGIVDIWQEPTVGVGKSMSLWHGIVNIARARK
jgi:hypothetical protein